MIRRELFQQELELILSLHPAGGQQFLHQLEHRHDVALFNGIAVRVLGGQVLGHQQEHGSQKALGGIVEKSILPILGAVAAAGVDEGLGEDLGVFLCLGLCRQVFGVGFIDIHVLVDQMKQVVAVRAGGITQIQHGDLVSVAVLGNTGIIAEQVALGIRAEEGHPAGEGIFDVGVQKERGLSGAAGGGDHGVDVIGVHQSCNMVFGPFAAKDKALLFRQMLSLAPQLWFKRDMGIGLPNLLFGSPACGSVLAVAHSLGFDSVKGIVMGEKREAADHEKHDGAYHDKCYNLRWHMILLLISTP